MKKLPFALMLFEMISSVPKQISLISIGVFATLGVAHLGYATYLFMNVGYVKNMPYFLSSSLGCFALMAIYFVIYHMSKLNGELISRGVFIESYFENTLEMDEELEAKLDDLAISRSAVISIKTISKEIRSF